MKKLIVIALAMVLALGLSASALASFGFGGPDLTWEANLDGFSDGNFRAGGTVFGSSPGYLNGMSTTGYAVEAGVAVTGGELGGAFGLNGMGNEAWAKTELDEHWTKRIFCWTLEGGTYGKTIEVFQQLEQTEIVTGDSLVTTLMRQAFTATGYPDVQMKQEVNRIGPDLTYQFIAGNGDGPGFVQSFTVQNGAAYGLIGAEIAGGDFQFMGHNIVDYTDDSANAWGWYELDGGFGEW
jgi:hypothetical protein